MNIFGNPSDLPQDVEKKIEELVERLEKKEDLGELSIYYGYPFIELDGRETIMKSCIICLKGIISLYVNEEEKGVYRRHLSKLMMESQELSEIFLSHQEVIHSIHIDSLEEIMDTLENEKEWFSIRNYRELNAIIQNMYGLNHRDDREICNENTLGALIKSRNNEINMLDQEQFEMIYKKTNSHTRIRGLAGSGKTILLVKKMAYMHYKNRDLELVYVFYTKSLKQYIKDLFLNFYRDFEKYEEPDMKKIHILHAWGGTEMEGFYSRACKENGINMESYNDVVGANKFDRVCKNLLEKLNKNGLKMYDYIFVDEAQDFTAGFFDLALSTLKHNGKLIYAYDELQALNDNSESIPSKERIFNEELCEDINLSICYRTPKNILVSAHALGLGIYRRNKEGNIDIINMMQDYSIWTAVGYEEISGKLGYGQNVVLGRREVINKVPDECVSISAAGYENEQYESVCEEICRLIEKEDVLPEDILVIDLAGIKFQSNYEVFKRIFSEKVRMHQGVISNVHLVNKNNALKFKKKGSVPYTTIFRAKGNEANIVFILNAQAMSAMQTFSRNRLFTAMTRAKFKVYIHGVSGAAMTTLIDEFNEIKEKDFTLEFRYPTEEELCNMRTIAKTEAKNADTYTKVFQSLKDNEKLTIEILKEQIGAGSIDELIVKLQEYKKDE